MVVSRKGRYRVVGTCFLYDFNFRPECTLRFLVIKRAPHLKTFPGRYSVPGGGMESCDHQNACINVSGGEKVYTHSLEMAVSRELLEEIGLYIPIELFEYLGSGVYELPELEGGPTLLVRFAAPYQGGVIKLDLEAATEYKWLRALDLSQYDFVGNIALELKDFDSKLRARAAGIRGS